MTPLRFNPSYEHLSWRATKRINLWRNLAERERQPHWGAGQRLNACNKINIKKMPMMACTIYQLLKWGMDVSLFMPVEEVIFYPPQLTFLPKRIKSYLQMRLIFVLRINSINALFAERQCSLLKEKIAELGMPVLHCLNSQYVITYSSFRRAIHANGSNYTAIITCLSERLQMSRHVTEIGASHTINTSICVWHT